MMQGLTFALIAALAAPSTQAPAVRVGLDPRLPPWVYVPGRDTLLDSYLEPPRLTQRELSRIAGLEVDILRALERRLAVRFEIVQTRWRDLEAELLASRFDVLLNAWTPSPATPAGILATDPYYTWGLLVVTRRGDASIRTLADLAGRRLGHFPDPTVLRAVHAMSDSIGAERVVVDDGGEQMFHRLSLGELDAVVFDSASVRWRVARDPTFRILGEPLNQLGYHAGIRASDRGLWERFQAAIREFVASSEAREIQERWESPGAPAP